MTYYEIFLMAVGLSMDAFACAITCGVKPTQILYKKALVYGLFFGVFQALMPLIGWLVGRMAQQLIMGVDHWIAFLLLAGIGGKMLYEAFFHKSACPTGQSDSIKLGPILILAIATSIDALVMGIVFSVMSVAILPAVSLIGVTTFCFGFSGILIGRFTGQCLGKLAEILGGLVLIGIGCKILVDHTM